MGIILIGEPIITKFGTKVSRYIENGKMYKLIEFSQSNNRVANKKGLKKTLVTYGEGNKPEKINDTFERTVYLNSPKDSKVEVSHKQTQKSEIARYKYILDKKNAKMSKQSVIYKGYNLFIEKTKQKITKEYKDVLPVSLYEDIINRYGTEEKSIRKIVDEHVDLDEYSLNSHAQNRKLGSFKLTLRAIERKEQEFININQADPDTKKAIAMTNAWTSSNLRVDFRFATQKGCDWSILKAVWLKCLYPEKTIYPTDKLIDGYLVYQFKNAQKRNYYGANPINKYVHLEKLDNNSIRLLKGMYRYSRELDESYNGILKNPLYKILKDSVNIKEMKETIEELEQHYKNAFFKTFWVDSRRERFSKALNAEYAKFNMKADISDETLEKAMTEVIEVEK